MIHVIRTGVFGVNTLIVEVEKGKVFVVDPAACSLSGDENIIVDYLKKNKLECVGILLTHSHFDHVTGIAPVIKAFPNIPISIHEAEYQEFQNPPGEMGTAVIQFFGATELISEVKKQPSATQSLHDGQNYFGWTVLHTPGHTPGSICLYKDGGETGRWLISGDTLFDYGGYGRTDMQGGNESQILQSLERLHNEIPAGTLVYPGHENFGFKF